MRTTRQTALGLVPVAEFAKKHAATVEDYIASAQGRDQIRGVAIVSGVSEDLIRQTLRALAQNQNSHEYTIQGPRGSFTIAVTSPAAQSAI